MVGRTKKTANARQKITEPRSLDVKHPVARALWLSVREPASVTAKFEPETVTESAGVLSEAVATPFQAFQSA